MRKLLSSLAGFLLLLSVLPPAVYADEGIATWYGPGFQGNRMSNGQIYNMNDPTTTAANRWPLGTWLKVTNPANGKSVTVQVRDRGAFSHALDLSYAAFASLDDPKKMQLRVVYEVVSGPDSQPTPSKAAPALPPASPPAAATPPPTPPGVIAPINGDEYIVQVGDTLARIATAAGVPLTALVTLNGIDSPDNIAPGQRLRLHEVARPTGSARGGTADGAARMSTNATEYVIKPGDTLDSIANSIGIDASTLASLNGISDPNMIQIGQPLRTSNSASVVNAGAAQSAGKANYNVVAGDTLSGIAAQYGVSEDAILKLNGLKDPDELLIGSVLQIPAANSPSASGQLSPSPRRYTVKQGDTLDGVALVYGISSDTLARYNGVDDPNLLQPGQVLTIP